MQNAQFLIPGKKAHRDESSRQQITPCAPYHPDNFFLRHRRDAKYLTTELPISPDLPGTLFTKAKTN